MRNSNIAKVFLALAMFFLYAILSVNVFDKCRKNSIFALVKK